MQKSVMREFLRPFQRPRFVMQQRAAAHWNHLLAERSPPLKQLQAEIVLERLDLPLDDELRDEKGAH